MLHIVALLALMSSSYGMSLLKSCPIAATVPEASGTVSEFLAFVNSGRLLLECPGSGSAGQVYLMEEGREVNEELRQRCRYDVFVPRDRELWPASKRFLADLLLRVRADLAPTEQDTLLDAGEWSHFVSLTYPSIDAALPSLRELRRGADAWELRVDLLEDISPASLHRQISLLRCSCPLPVVFTVRSEGQIGRFPRDPDRIFALLREGLRAGVEWLDVEACWPSSYLASVTHLCKTEYKGTSRVLGSLHVTTPQTEQQLMELFRACELDGKADMVKVVTGASSDADCRLVHKCGQRASKPYIGLALGAAGALSRVLNKRFTPVTHPLMATAAPGQLSAAELMDRRVALGLVAEKRFFLFGSPIKQSMSPAMHNAAFDALLLPHHYSLCESEDVEAYEAIVAGPGFGGASVTIPHKESVQPFLSEVRGAATEIGAVNTIVREGERLVGCNTDWLGMKVPIGRLLGESRVGAKGLVVGAGGTAKAACYALKALGLAPIVYNRSPEKGSDLAEKVGGRFVQDLSTIAGEDIAVVISTVPASAAFTLPSSILDKKPVVLDVVYKPVRTPLLEQVSSQFSAPVMASIFVGLGCRLRMYSGSHDAVGAGHPAV